MTSVFCASVKAPPSVVSNTIDPLPPFADGNLSASWSCTWLVLVFGMEIADEIVPAKRPYVRPAMPMMTIQAITTDQARRAENRPRR